MLRKSIATILILVMSAQSFYKLACVTYYQLNKDYIAAFLCENRDNPITLCYGQCFLSKALGLESDNNTNSLSSNHKFDFPVFALSETITNEVTVEVDVAQTSYYQWLLREANHDNIFRPPMFVQ